VNFRKSLGNAIAEAEEMWNRGVPKLLRWRDGRTETVSPQLRVMGVYGDTTLYDCPDACSASVELAKWDNDREIFAAETPGPIGSYQMHRRDVLKAAALERVLK